MSVLLSRRQAVHAALASFASIVAFRPEMVFGNPSTSITAFDERLASAKTEDLENARSFRELEFRTIGPSPTEMQAQPGLARRYKSDKGISNRSREMLIRFEVTGRSVYESRYRKPMWPKGESGVTVGIGYDVGYASKELLAEDWRDLIPEKSLQTLQGACGVKGSTAGDLVAFVQDVDIPWSAATAQLDRMTKFIAGETVNAFPGSEKLSADSFGALVSLVYNRGSGMKPSASDPLDRRREMRNIRTLVQQGQFPGVASEIRSMTRIWKGVPDARGLLERRELEAQLFEIGLQS